MAAYGAKSGGGEDPQAGLAYLRELITKHVTVQDKSGREALQDFTSGNGDVLISYENEAITAQKKGQQVDYVIPDQTILDREPDRGRLEVQAPRAGQGVRGLRALGAGPAEVRRLGLPPGRRRRCCRRTPRSSRLRSGLFTIRDLGGWSKVNDAFFDPDKGSVAEIENDAGVSTAK